MELRRDALGKFQNYTPGGKGEPRKGWLVYGDQNRWQHLVLQSRSRQSLLNVINFVKTTQSYILFSIVTAFTNSP